MRNDRRRTALRAAATAALAAALLTPAATAIAAGADRPAPEPTFNVRVITPHQQDVRGAAGGTE
ncbi:hypothetical protein [Streptomyces orinoci]|uniref:Uncharacterized protein n=1 Tax=Streptomyces orinoci TaxID=67339 RepID=A0ABV3JUU8_STRON|nr:hypothetical protein [Streptomyces orinoci]